MKLSQILNGECIKRIKVLETENARLRRIVEASGNKVRSQKSDGTVPETLVSHVSAINILGKKFAVMVYPWIKATAFVNLTGRPDTTLTGVLRYQNNEVGELACTTELYDNIPSNFHRLMQGEPRFGELVG